MRRKGSIAETNILVVDDEKEIADLIESYLVSDGYKVFKANNAKEGLEILENEEIQLVLLDIMMPGMDGYQLAREVRSSGNNVPFIFLTAKASPQDKAQGFELGIDDYMVKPIDYSELIWRIRAILRRAQIADSRAITVGGLRVDSAAYTVTYNGRNIELTHKEFDLLFKLLSYPNMIFTKNQLLDEIWGADSASGDDTVKVHISRLRNKSADVEEVDLIAVKGIGYKAVIKA